MITLRGKSKTCWTYVDRIKILMEIFAIFIAAYWTYSIFWKTEADLLLSRSDLAAQVTWNNKTETQCEAEFRVDVKNIGKKNLEVSKVNLKSWYLVEPSQLSESENVRLLDPLKEPEGNAFLLKQNTELLKYTYLPDEKYTVGFLYAVKRSPGKRIVFKVEIWRKGTAGEAAEMPMGDYSTWDWVCGENPYETDPEAKSKSKEEKKE